MTRRLILLLALCPLATAQVWAEELVRRVGRVTVRIDASRGFPGGVVVVRLGGARLGSAWALLDGRRAPFYPDHGALRALVPVATATEPGPATLGIEIAARRGAQRIAVPVPIGVRRYGSQSVPLSEPKRSLFARAEALHDARRLLGQVRTESASPAPGPLKTPIDGSGRGFGETRTYAGLLDAESRVDALGGERHRGLDFPVPVGTAVRVPAAGTVVFAGPLALSGETVIVDHGQGVISVLQHLSRVSVRAGNAVGGGAVVGLSGDTGLAAEPLLEWRVYLHGVAVDPLVLGQILG